MTKSPDIAERALRAVAEAHRWDRAFEKPIESMLGKNRHFDEASLRAVAREFMVTRTLRWEEKGGGEELTQLVKVLNSLPLTWGGKLQVHYLHLVDTVSGECAALWEKTSFHSALSKFYMFRTGRRWPPFDSHAANALGVPQGHKGNPRAAKFYKKLDGLEFSQTCEDIRKALAHSLDIPAERVLDKFLLVDGMTTAAVMADSYFHTQPEETQRKMQKAAEMLEAVFKKRDQWVRQ
ncbi:hypothetical protein ACRDNQ_03795 [Palleronia sp. KMU-117]|uniref:hypothetical protein n=1 Tax=Palleronia sp. KMU-117 TaxID=3434108 RepID=UPI003D76261B